MIETKAITGEQFLNSIRHLNYEITALDTERVRVADCRQDLMDKAESLGAALSGVCVQHGVNSKTETIGVQLADLMTVEDIVKKLNDYQNRINHKIDTLVDMKQKAQIIIDHIPDARHRALLIHRYISNLKWPTIADIMGYTQNWVEVKLKREAVEAFEAAGKRVM